MWDEPWRLWNSTISLRLSLSCVRAPSPALGCQGTDQLGLEERERLRDDVKLLRSLVGIRLFGEQNAFLATMWKETFVTLSASASFSEKPTRWIVDEITHFMALRALALQVEFANSFWIS